MDGSQAPPPDARAASLLSNKRAQFEEADNSSCNWYFQRSIIDNESPSRKDGVDLRKEVWFRKTTCTYCQELGMRLKVPQLTIATAIAFCHRFFLRQSHAKNDRFVVATTCIFLAGKVEETPRPLANVIMLAYEIRNKKDPTAAKRIKEDKALFEREKELILMGERLVLNTLGFDLNINHPYKPLLTAIKKFLGVGGESSQLAQVAWNFVNDGLRTSLSLQFKPHHIAAGAIFLAAKFLKINLPTDDDTPWWTQFGVTPPVLEDVSSQMLELYEQNTDKPSASRGSGDRASREARRQKALAQNGVTSSATTSRGHPPTPALADRPAPGRTPSEDDVMLASRNAGNPPLPPKAKSIQSANGSTTMPPPPEPQESHAGASKRDGHQPMAPPSSRSPVPASGPHSVDNGLPSELSPLIHVSPPSAVGKGAAAEDAELKLKQRRERVKEMLLKTKAEANGSVKTENPGALRPESNGHSVIKDEVKPEEGEAIEEGEIGSPVEVHKEAEGARVKQEPPVEREEGETEEGEFPVSPPPRRDSTALSPVRSGDHDRKRDHERREDRGREHGRSHGDHEGEHSRERSHHHSSRHHHKDSSRHDGDHHHRYRSRSDEPEHDRHAKKSRHEG